MIDTIEQQKREAAVAAVGLIEDGMILGVGTGSTVYYAIEALAEKVRGGFQVTCVPTSQATSDHLQQVGLSYRPLADLGRDFRPDLCIDGADEIDPDLNLIKGRGGALLREKIVADASDKLVIIADQAKIVTHLGEKARLPVEVLPDAIGHTGVRLSELFSEIQLRLDYRTDNGNAIYDCLLEGAPEDLSLLEQIINQIPGVLENGLFINRAQVAFIATSDGLMTLEKKNC